MKNRWITMLLVLALVCALLPQLALSSRAEGDVAINETNFPDGTFRSYVSDELDRDRNGSLSTEELQACVTFDLYGQNITSLKGIEYFTSLCSLNVHGNQLTALDLSKNTALTELYCYDNQLTALDVSKNTALEWLDCYGNQLTALDVSNNTALTWLDCGGNQLTALDVSKNTALDTLYCDENQLTALDVSKNTALEWLYCDGNQLTALDVSNNTALTELSCYGNKIPVLDVSVCAKLADALRNGTKTVTETYVSYESDNGILYVDPGQRTIPAANPFTDVPEDKYYYNAVMWAVNHDPQITKGTDATHFSPGVNCKRRDIVTFLWRANHCPEPSSTDCPFTDVPANAYYTKAVLWAVESGITSGTSATTFSPAATCKRRDVVTFLWRAAGSPEPSSTENPFHDVPNGAYYTKAVLWAVEKGITNGLNATTFGPTRICTRGQIVTFLYRAYK